MNSTNTKNGRGEVVGFARDVGPASDLSTLQSRAQAWAPHEADARRRALSSGVGAHETVPHRSASAVFRAASLWVSSFRVYRARTIGDHLDHMSAPSYWLRNRLLLALPASDLEQLIPELEQIRCERGQVLMDADSPLDHVFFPDSGVVSVVAVYADGSIIEMATIGREGCTSVQAIFGAERSSVRLLVQIPGGAAKMPRTAFTRAMGSMPSFRILMYAYAQAFLEQILVSVACNGAHSLKQRLARWLLTMRDRGDDDALLITQNLLAEMLGVQRPTVSNAARIMEHGGLILRGRRQVSILDRQGLVAASCECYQLVRARITFHLPKTYA